MKQIRKSQFVILIVVCVIFPDAGESSDLTAGMGPGAPAARVAPLNFKTRLCDNFEKAISLFSDSFCGYVRSSASCIGATPHSFLVISCV